MLKSELIVHMLKCTVRGHVCCSLIHDSSFFHSFIIHSSLDTIALSRVFSSPNTLETPRNEAVYLILSSTESFKTKRNLLSISSLPLKTREKMTPVLQASLHSVSLSNSMGFTLH